MNFVKYLSQMDDEMIRDINWLAFWGAIFSGCITTIYSLIGFQGLSSLNLLDAAITFGMAYGIRRKNRVCALIYFIFYIIGHLYLLRKVHLGTPGIIVFLLFTIFFTLVYFMNALGSFA